MKAKHTQGEWKVGYYNSNTTIYADKEGIAEHIFEFDGQNKQIEANAKLIASAPALLEVLQEIVENLQPIRGQRLRKALNAIKQATE